MKALFSILIISNLFISSAFSAPRTVEETVRNLGKLGFGSSEHFVVGKTAEEMLKNYYLAEYNETPQIINKEIDQMAFGDEVDMGFTSLNSVLAMNSFAVSFLEDSLENNEDEAEVLKFKAKIYDLNHDWVAEVKRLNNLGVKFAYAGDGPGYCGVSFIVLIVIDVASQKLYRINLSYSASC